MLSPVRKRKPGSEGEGRRDVEDARRWRTFTTDASSCPTLLRFASPRFTIELPSRGRRHDYYHHHHP